MKVNIQEVTVSTVSKGRNTYQVAEVVYTTDRGENKTKKVMSFGDGKPVFDVLSKGGKGWYDTENSGAPYYSWTKVTPAGGEDQPAATSQKSGVVKSTYETPEERKVKQLYIIRQSSIANAIDYLRLTATAGDVGVNDVLNVAQEFVDFVYGTEDSLLHEAPEVE